jgi:hypothetical protein
MTALEMIIAERQRQVETLGWTAAHDDSHKDGSLASVAALYATPRPLLGEVRYVGEVRFVDPWPWEQRYDRRPHKGNVVLPNATLSTEDRIKQLVKAAALIVAEIERLQRVGQ